jgi:hypothetical protein
MKKYMIFLAFMTTMNPFVFAKEGACERKAIQAAARFARIQQSIAVDPAHAEASSWDINKKGQEELFVQMPFAEGNGDCWLAIIVTVERGAGEQCKILHVEEDLSADTCS